MPLVGRQLRILAAVIARLIPTDEHGPGAGEANVVHYIERALASDYEAHLNAYSEGLERIDALSREAQGFDFAALPPDEQDQVLRVLEEGGRESDRLFFDLVLQHTKEGMFGDPAWGGNAGYVGWNLIGYPGPRHVWTAEDQELDVIISPNYPPQGKDAA